MWIGYSLIVILYLFIIFIITKYMSNTLSWEILVKINLKLLLKLQKKNKIYYERNYISVHTLNVLTIQLEKPA